MQPLDLHVKNTFGVQGNAVLRGKGGRQPQLVLPLDLAQFTQCFGVVLQHQQPGKVIGIFVPAVADMAADKGRKRRVCHHQPAAERDAIRFIRKFFGVNVVKRFQLRRL
ncbi:hypothetical protein SDC9_203090 [bioreactor metagenome]|uniref:Uncharacterized protein n=1 Tax=bioreactor metagenome TaxID=1076179 RepID=A0A645IVG6_9ZZZZ